MNNWWLSEYKFFFFAVIVLLSKQANSSGTGDDSSLLQETFNSNGPTDGAGFGENFQLLTSVDENNPHVVSEVISSTAISCFVSARDIEGDVLTLTCPPGCHAVTEKLWGTGKYREDSYVCAAAIHDGRLSAEEGGTVTIRKLQETRTFYSGSLRNGVNSRQSEEGNAAWFFFQSSFEARRTLYTVSCFAKADFTLEDSYLAVCPPGCDVLSGGLWGTGTYTANSYVCVAAIHAGRIQASVGGRIVVNKKPGQASYIGSTEYGIESKSFGSYSSSFEVQGCPQMLSSFLSVGCTFRADHVMEDSLTVSCPSGCGDTNSEVTGSGPYSVRSHVCAAAVHHGTIDGTLGGKVTILKLKEAALFDGSRKNGVTARESKQRSRTFVFGGAIRDFPNLLQVACDTTVDYILEDVFAVNCPAGCLDTVVDAGVVIGSEVFTTSSSICSAAIHDGRISAEQGGPVTVRAVGSQSIFAAELRHGVQSSASETQQSAFVFGGNIEDVKTALRVSCDFAAAHAVNEEFTVSCPRGCTHRYPRGFIDSSDAAFHKSTTSICSLSPKFADKEVTVIRTLHGAKYTASSEEIQQELIERPTTGQYAIVGRTFPQPTVISVSCEAQVNHINDATFTAICPPGCNGTKVFGTGVYSDDSQICVSAIHDGRISERKGGAVTVRKMKGMDFYYGSESNRIQSLDKDVPWITSFVFQSTLYHRTSVFTITCGVQGSFITSKMFGVICPSGCQSTQEKVWGAGIYSEYSYICAAAIHDGKITDEGGLVKVRRAGTKSTYTGSQTNGVFSRSKESDGEAAFSFLA